MTRMIFNITKEEFSKRIEKYVEESFEKETPYINAVVHFFEEYSFDYSLANKLLSQPILEKIEAEGMDLNLIPKSKGKLPFR